MKATYRSIQLRPVLVVHRFIVLLSSIAPGLRSRLQTAKMRALYSGIGAGLKNEDSAFMNYGYAPLDSNTSGLHLLPEDETDRFSIQLYSRIVGARELRSKDVLEVGCGRGGACRSSQDISIRLR
jgi:hypothetical protein